jgi:hypothetical protein
MRPLIRDIVAAIALGNIIYRVPCLRPSERLHRIVLLETRGADIAFAILARATNISRRQGRVGPSGYFNSMPDVVHNTQELLDAANQRRLEISKTTSRDDLLLGLTGTPSREEIALLEAVDHLFRLALRDHAADLRAKKTEARDADIDFQILWNLAAGKSQRAVAAHFGIKQQLVNRIKATRLQTIYRDVVKPLTPTISRPAPQGIQSGTSEPFGGNTIYENEQRHFRSIGRDRTTQKWD